MAAAAARQPGSGGGVGQVRGGCARRECGGAPRRGCHLLEKGFQAEEPGDPPLGRPGKPSMGVLWHGEWAPGAQGGGPPCSAAGCGLEPAWKPKLTLKRPRPGRLWHGPSEAWCSFPQPKDSGWDVEESAPEEGDSFGRAPDDLMPRAVPLLLFLRSLPTIREVALYFAEALGQVPVTEGGCRIRFERLLVFAWGSSWRRGVLSEGARGAPGVTLEWWTNDDFGLSELREFFEAPFFRRSESERFYEWMGEGGMHEADFRGHRLRMSVQKREGVWFVRIQWWRGSDEAEGPDAMVRPECWGEG